MTAIPYLANPIRTSSPCGYALASARAYATAALARADTAFALARRTNEAADRAYVENRDGRDRAKFFTLWVASAEALGAAYDARAAARSVAFDAREATYLARVRADAMAANDANARIAALA